MTGSDQLQPAQGEARRLRAGLYARTASRDPADRSPIEEQLRVAREFAGQQGWVVVQEYVDWGYPGNSSQRPGLERMMEDARNGEIQVVVVSNLYRLSRSLFNLLECIRGLHRHGVQVVSAGGEVNPQAMVRWACLWEDIQKYAESAQAGTPR
jgi:DNA invertase Pin-like site-specific DNA recombinase